MKLRIAFLLLVVAIGSHLYLSNHFYQLSFGLSPDGSVCNINKVFSCDTVSASKFSSLLGIPMAAWGAATNTVILVLLLGWLIGWGDDLARLSSYTFYLSGFSAFTSLIMASISSLVLRTFCLFCIATYICSFLIFELLRRSRPEDNRKFADHIKALFGPAASYLAFLVLIPVGAFLLNRGILMNYGAKDLAEFIGSSISDWQNSPEVILTNAPAMSKGASDSDAKMTIVEFADFRCGHCRAASAPLSAFVASRPDVQLKFMNFPLDSTCNPNVEFGDGISCLMARSVTCAEKLSQKGWDLHDEFFKNQENYVHAAVPELTKIITDWGTSHGLDGAAFTACIDDEATKKHVADQAGAGKIAGVKGTPTILVNGRKLPRGQSLHVLEKAYELSSK